MKNAIYMLICLCMFGCGCGSSDKDFQEERQSIAKLVREHQTRYYDKYGRYWMKDSWLIPNSNGLIQLGITEEDLKNINIQHYETGMLFTLPKAYGFSMVANLDEDEAKDFWIGVHVDNEDYFFNIYDDVNETEAVDLSGHASADLFFYESNNLYSWPDKIQQDVFEELERAYEEEWITKIYEGFGVIPDINRAELVLSAFIGNQTLFSHAKHLVRRATRINEDAAAADFRLESLIDASPKRVLEDLETVIALFELDWKRWAHAEHTKNLLGEKHAAISFFLLNMVDPERNATLRIGDRYLFYAGGIYASGNILPKKEILADFPEREEATPSFRVATYNYYADPAGVFRWAWNSDEVEMSTLLEDAPEWYGFIKRDAQRRGIL